MQRRLYAHMRDQVFDASEPKYVLSFLKTLTMARHSSAISESAAMWVTLYFRTIPSNAALFSRLQRKSSIL